MRRMTVAACLVSLVLGGAAAAPLSKDSRERFAAGLAAHKAGDWAVAAREFADPAWAGSPLEDYALLFQAESQLRQGDSVAARALATQATDRTPESGLTPLALVRAAAVLREAGDPAATASGCLRSLLPQFASEFQVPRQEIAFVVVFSLK